MVPPVFDTSPPLALPAFPEDALPPPEPPVAVPDVDVPPAPPNTIGGCQRKQKGEIRARLTRGVLVVYSTTCAGIVCYGTTVSIVGIACRSVTAARGCKSGVGGIAKAGEGWVLARCQCVLTASWCNSGERGSKGGAGDSEESDIDNWAAHRGV